MSPRPLSGRPPEALVMAGGEGRRLGALTAHTPKPMLPVNGRPVLQHILQHLRTQGVEHVYLSVRHLSHVISDYFGDGHWLGMRLDYVVERQPLGTAGAVGLLPPLSEPLLVVNGDVMTLVPVAALTAHHHEHGAAMTVGHVEHRVSVPYGVIECGRPDVLRLREKPEVVLRVIAGVYLLAPEVVRGIPVGDVLAMPDLIETVLTTRRVIGFALPGPWLDIGTPEAYARAPEFADLMSAALPAPRTSTVGDPVAAEQVGA